MKFEIIQELRIAITGDVLKALDNFERRCPNGAAILLHELKEANTQREKQKEQEVRTRSTPPKGVN